MVDKVVRLEDAIATIDDGDTVCVSGFVGIGTPEGLVRGLQDRFLAHAAPKDISLLFAAAPGDGKDRGLNRLAIPGLVKRAIGGHWSLVPKLGAMAMNNEIEAYNLPLGCISQLYRDIGAGKPGMFSKVGLHTFVDPRQSGGAINDCTTKPLVELMELAGEEWLFYHAVPVDVALIRGTTADRHGNITMEREALTLDMLPIAIAAKNSGGLVIAQVERIAANGSLDPKQVIVPGNLVDCVVVAERDEHHQTYKTPYEHAFTGRMKADVGQPVPMDLTERKIIARRAAMELPVNGVVNLGIGMPEGVSAVANEEGVIDNITLTTEAGVLGGVPQSGLDFGAAINANAIIQTNQQFDFYDGGGLDLACLGMAETDATGNVNVSRFKDRFAGAGGFINISQNARKVVFVGTFTAGGLKVAINDGKMSIAQEGRSRKFINQVEQITFNGAYAASQGKEVLYVTERCVFKLGESGQELIEVAPGIDIEKDILGQMDFKPVINDVKEMDPSILGEAPMKLRTRLLAIPNSDRLFHDKQQNIVFVNLSGLTIETEEDVRIFEHDMNSFFQQIGQKVNLVSNYDGISISPKMAAKFANVLGQLEYDYYLTATRYTTSAFLRQKLGQDLKNRSISPHIFETRQEAAAYIAANRSD
ncbi:acyl CoA:acetate/3-ketoacid CoA transferase [Pseudahrensia aquimaris]|uniref:Acyl CoA:acetate/3-ketoacid CoA transferase n=1 Tax=Pseudahrensia aquimaris TaxID=744461 RepID=A0ABW3FFZ0_9HYPH